MADAGPAKQSQEVPAKAVEVATQEVQRLVQQHMVGVQVGPAPHPFAQHLTPEHVTKSIEVADRQDSRKHFTQRFSLLVGTVAFLLVCLLFVLYEKTEALEKIIALLVGFLGGYGYAKSKGKD